MKPSANFSRHFLRTVASWLLLASFAQAGTEKVLHSFQITDGESPYDGVIFDSAGNLYGTTFYGGSKGCSNDDGCGVVFKLTPAADGSWAEKAIYTFTGGADGSHPYSTLIFDAAGNLYGTTYVNDGVGSGLGTAFRLTPQPDGSWQFTLLHSFAGGKDGARPIGLLAMDSAGNLYGSTYQGGSHNSGTVFELSPAAGTWKETLLHTFTGGQDGYGPTGGLVFGPDGSLYGTAILGGTCCGVVFELSRGPNGTWHETVLYSLTGGAGGSEPTSLAFDSSGNLYGSSQAGGSSAYCPGGCGLVFRLSPEANGAWKETSVHSFNGGNGQEPWALKFDSAGDLYGAAYNGGLGAGLIFKLEPGAPWTENVIYEFTLLLGGQPVQPLTFDASGNIYGTAVVDGAGDAGVVFEVTP